MNLNHNLDHYYRDWRGGIDYLMDYFFPHVVTDMITYSLDDVGCYMCKAGSGLVRTFFGNKIVTWMINEIAIGGCRLVMKPLTGFIPETCPGIINQQWRDSIYPILTQTLLSEELFCTFDLGLC